MTDTDYSECYEGGLLSALLFMKSQAEVAGFDLANLGMSAFDPTRDKDALEAAFEPMAATPSSASADDNGPLVTAPEYLHVLRSAWRGFAQAARSRLAGPTRTVADEAYAQAQEDVLGFLEDARLGAGLDEQFARPCSDCVMGSKLPENDIAQLVAQIAAAANAPGDKLPQLKAELATVAASVAALGKALDAPDEPAARRRVADELDRTRSAMLAALAKTQVKDVPVGALAGALELVGRWLRGPTPENTAEVERLVAAMRAAGGDELWTDQAAEAKRKAELDADVQKSLDEIKAGMPKLKL